MDSNKVFNSFCKKLIELLGHDNIEDLKDVSLNSIGVDSFVSIELKEWCNRLEEKYKNIFKNINFLESSCTISSIENLLKDELPTVTSPIELKTNDHSISKEKLSVEDKARIFFSQSPEELDKAFKYTEVINVPISSVKNTSNKELEITLNMKWKSGNISVNITDLQTNIYKSNNNYIIDITS
jgi:hypothetical protein